jgi:hypothetical protein
MSGGFPAAQLLNLQEIASVLPELVHPLPQMVVLLVNSTINVSIEFTVRRTRSARIPTAVLIRSFIFAIG